MKSLRFISLNNCEKFFFSIHSFIVIDYFALSVWIVCFSIFFFLPRSSISKYRMNEWMNDPKMNEFVKCFFLIFSFLIMKIKHWCMTYIWLLYDCCMCTWPISLSRCVCVCDHEICNQGCFFFGSLDWLISRSFFLLVVGWRTIIASLLSWPWSSSLGRQKKGRD